MTSAQVVIEHRMDTLDVRKAQGTCPADGGVRPSGVGALRVGRHKLVVGEQKYASWYGAFSPNSSALGSDNKFHIAEAVLLCSPGCVYDLEVDPTEHVDLAPSRPELVQRLLARFGEIDRWAHPPPTKPMFVGDV